MKNPLKSPALPKEGTDHEHPAFLTGSRAYGNPTADSDFDIVLPCSNTLAWTLRKHFVDWGKSPSTVDSIKIGNLNLLLSPTQEDYAVWVEGTKQLIEVKPVTRSQAVTLFQRLRKAAGIEEKWESYLP